MIVSIYHGYLYIPAPSPGPGPRSQFVFTDPGTQFVFTGCRPSIRIYRHWLIRTGNNKSQMLHILLLFLFLLSNSFVTVIVIEMKQKVI